jgi:hypothetical protein
VVHFSGRAGHDGQTARIAIYCADGDQLIDVEPWSVGRDELTLALEAPAWGRYGTFAGHPRVCWDRDVDCG